MRCAAPYDRGQRQRPSVNGLALFERLGEGVT